MSLKANNHFIPRFYLRNFSSDKNKIWTYSVLVPHKQVPNWKQKSINKATAVRKHLYTSTIGGQESDKLENWLDKKFEAPAKPVISKVINNSRISKSDWKILISFLASQRVRTPAYFLESGKQLEEFIPNLIIKSSEESIEKPESFTNKDQQIIDEFLPLSVDLPFKISKNINRNKDSIEILYEILLGRELWIFQIKRALTYTAKILNQHRWTILLSPQNMHWVTSDNPVVQLNFCSYKKYNLSGGWGSRGTELMLPLSPKHLLYTQVGRTVPQKGTRVAFNQAILIQKVLIENAHREIYAEQPAPFVMGFRKREVNKEKYDYEEQEWNKWHEKQTTAELDFSEY